MVLFVFVVMLLNLGPPAEEQESRWLTPGIWIGPTVLAAMLAGEVFFLVLRGLPVPAGVQVPPQRVGALLFGPYVIGVELASFLLLAGLVGAHHLGRHALEGRRP
jgi:NADH-quinone oxidoreductase subunit J